jgi:hypothetical protein
VTSSDAKSCLLALLLRCRSPSSITAAQRLGLAVESQDLGVWPLPVGAVKRANCRSTRLPYGLNKSGSVLEPDGPTSGDGSIDGGGATRDGVSEVDGMVVHGASGPWGWPYGPMEILTVWQIADTPTRPVTTVM